MVFQPILRTAQQTIHLVLLYVENFTFGGKKAADDTYLEAEDMDMYLLRQKFRSQAVSLSNDGQRKCSGDIIQITSVACYDLAGSNNTQLVSVSFWGAR
jgi:hypothetical protein